jgi:hypothetical protein
MREKSPATLLQRKLCLALRQLKERVYNCGHLIAFGKVTYSENLLWGHRQTDSCSYFNNKDVSVQGCRISITKDMLTVQDG